MEHDIEDFISERTAYTAISNSEEFIDFNENESCSKVTTVKIDKTVHIQATVADNQDGPLQKSISTTSGMLVSPHHSIRDSQGAFKFNALEERVRNIETHVGIVLAPVDKSLSDRVKILEDKILRIEQYYPQIAAHVFNYGKAEAEASSRPGGRVSKLPKTSEKEDLKSKSKKQRRLEESSIDTDSLDYLKKRMAQIKCDLLKKR